MTVSRDDRPSMAEPPADLACRICYLQLHTSAVSDLCDDCAENHVGGADKVAGHVPDADGCRRCTQPLIHDPDIRTGIHAMCAAHEGTRQ